jgi:hypothetical protein
MERPVSAVRRQKTLRLPLERLPTGAPARLFACVFLVQTNKAPTGTLLELIMHSFIRVSANARDTPGILPGTAPGSQGYTRVWSRSKHGRLLSDRQTSSPAPATRPNVRLCLRDLLNVLASPGRDRTVDRRRPPSLLPQAEVSVTPGNHAHTLPA